MHRMVRVGSVFLVLILVLGLVGPFLVPVAPLEGTVPAKHLADPDSQFAEIGGLEVHYKIAGAGDPVLVLLHGFAASTFSWREVTAPLAQVGTVLSFDRPASGLTERPLAGEWQGENPYSAAAQADLTIDLLDSMGVEKAVLIGHSAGGAIATLTALQNPERVAALVLVAPAIYTGGGPPGWIGPLLRTPQMRRLGPLFARVIQSRGEDLARLAWHDPDRLTPDMWAGYTRPLQVENWDRALWELTLASRPLDLAERLGELEMPVLVITGDDDRLVPMEDSVRLAEELPNAQLAMILQCGHIPQEECPGPFLEAVLGFVSSMP
jgi:pimeloyl-ACP methyl ester carboxylesterase